MPNQDNRYAIKTQPKHFLGLLDETDLLKEIILFAKRFQNISLKRRDMRRLLDGRTLGILFATPDIHEELMLSQAMKLLGGNVVHLNAQNWQARNEAVIDTAHALQGARLDCLALRVHAQSDAMDFAKYGNFSVLACATDDYRPFGALADLFALFEHFHRTDGLKLAYYGDGNNLCHSLLLTCAQLGVNITCCCPKGREPNADVVALAARSVDACVTSDPLLAAKDADALYAQSYPSEMNGIFESVKILDSYFRAAHEGCVYMNPLPAHRNTEASANVTDARYSLIPMQAAARLPIAMALLYMMTK